MVFINQYLVHVKVKGHLSICRGVGERNVSDTSQVKPFTHMTISSSEVAAVHKQNNTGMNKRVCARTVRVAVELSFTCQTERFEPKLGPVEDDEAVGLVRPGGRVLHISLEVS